MDRNKFGIKYLSLVGGAIEPGETPEEAVKREVMEETGFEIDDLRLVIIEDSGDVFGLHYIYVANHIGDKEHPELGQETIEYKLNEMKQNIFTPKWIPVHELEHANLLPRQLKGKILEFIKHGFPKEPINLSAKD